MTIKARFKLAREDFLLDVDWSIPAKGVTGLFGPSASGKTTLLRALAGLDRLDGGLVQFHREIWQSQYAFVPTHRRPLGYVFQEPSLFSHLTVQGNLDYAYRRCRPNSRRLLMADVVQLMGIEGLLKRPAMRLSGGQQQRVAIARALLRSPHWLLMDEPLASLDIRSRQEILPFLDSVTRELDLPILYVSHSIDEVARLCDRLVLIEAGHLVAQGPINEMLTRLDLPMAKADAAESVFECRVAEHDDTFGLTRVQFNHGNLQLPKIGQPAGSVIKAQIQARDVSVSLGCPQGTSILNTLEAAITEMSVNGDQVLLKLDLGGTFLLSRITRKSVHELNLDIGTRVFAQIKSVAVLT